MLRKKIGLALSGGGARGFSHVGVLRVLLESEIPIDMIAGTSAGSIVGGALAAGVSRDDLIRMVSEVRWRNMIAPSLSLLGMLSSAPMGRFLKRHFPVTRFEDLKIPFAAVACDLKTGREVVLKDSGDVITAIRASCAVPGVFVPVRDSEGRLLIDGGATSVTPVDAVRAMGADVVIAVDLLACGETYGSTPRTALGVVQQSLMMLLRTAVKNQHQVADLVIVPEIAHLRIDEISKRDEFLRLGEEAARERIDEIKELILGTEVTHERLSS